MELTPENIVDKFVLDTNFGDDEDLIKLIREYGEQQYQKGKFDHSKEISDENK